MTATGWIVFLVAFHYQVPEPHAQGLLAFMS